MELKLKYEGPFGDVGKIIAMPTGGWRHKRPVIKAEKCCQCGWCHIYCPTGSVIDETQGVNIDLSYCKGCGICASICPVDAIMMIAEA